MLTSWFLQCYCFLLIFSAYNNIQIINILKGEYVLLLYIKQYLLRRAVLRMENYTHCKVRWYYLKNMSDLQLQQLL